MPLNPDTLLEKRYKIITQLGEGGFGAVYRALDTRLNIECAVKELSLRGQDAIEQFRLEAEMLARLKHPGLPGVIDHFSEDGHNYLVMEYVPGLDLGQWLHQKGPVPEKQMLIWTAHILDALNYLHTRPQPIIHRDIKPSNIKIGSNNRAVLVDFGIAKVWMQGGQTTGTAQAVSPPYSPLEQYSSGQGGTNPRSDIYALGAALYLLLGGQRPPDPIQRSTGEIALLPLREINPALSAGVEKLVLKAMAMKQEDRWQSARQMWQALDRSSSQTQPAANAIRVAVVAAAFSLRRIGKTERLLSGAIILIIVLTAALFIAFNSASTKDNSTKSTLPPAVMAPSVTATPTLFTLAVTPTSTRVLAQGVNSDQATASAFRLASTSTPTASPTSITTPARPPNPPIIKHLTPRLLSPVQGTSFAGREALIAFEWSAAQRPLAADEYYVLIIHHRIGDDRIWLKNPAYLLPDERRWLADETDYNSELHWQVVVAQKRSGDPNEDPKVSNVSDYSDIWTFQWNIGGG